MSKTRDDGGWAFPVPNSANLNYEEGMTLRDYFAGQALAGILANPNMFADSDLGDGKDEVAARAAYIYAIQMLKQRMEL